jgi:hypothetical protein
MAYGLCRKCALRDNPAPYWLIRRFAAQSTVRIKRLRTMDPQIPLVSRVARLVSLSRLQTLQLSSLDRFYNESLDSLAGGLLQTVRSV